MCTKAIIKLKSKKKGGGGVEYKTDALKVATTKKSIQDCTWSGLKKNVIKEKSRKRKEWKTFEANNSAAKFSWQDFSFLQLSLLKVFSIHAWMLNAISKRKLDSNVSDINKS